MWKYIGNSRPAHAVVPRAGQESVWDYPRPPEIMEDSRPVIVSSLGTEIARSSRAVRVLETASPPTFYLPRSDVRVEFLERASGKSFCEWKGVATYYSVIVPGNPQRRRAAWSYEHPSGKFETIKGHLAFYPSRVGCFVDGAQVQPQPGEFYGGWVTSEIVGPFKGEPGSLGW